MSSGSGATEGESAAQRGPTVFESLVDVLVASQWEEDIVLNCCRQGRDLSLVRMLLVAVAPAPGALG